MLYVAVKKSYGTTSAPNSRFIVTTNLAILRDPYFLRNVFRISLLAESNLFKRNRKNRAFFNLADECIFRALRNLEN